MGSVSERRKGKRRLPSRFLGPLAVPAAANCCWSIDFMSDALGVTVVDLADKIQIAISLPAQERLRYGDAARETVLDKFSLETGSAGMQALFERVL